MTLLEALQLIVKIKGAAFLREQALINALANCKIYEETPQYKNVLKVLIREGVIAKALAVHNDEQRLKQLAANVASSYLWPVALVSHMLLSVRGALCADAQALDLPTEAFQPVKEALPAKLEAAKKKRVKPSSQNSSMSTSPLPSFSPEGVAMVPYLKGFIYVVRSQNEGEIYYPTKKRIRLFVNIIKVPGRREVKVFLSIPDGEFESRYYFQDKIEVFCKGRALMFCDDPSEKLYFLPKDYKMLTKMKDYRFLQAPRDFYNLISNYSNL